MQNAPKPQSCTKCGRVDAKPIFKSYDYPDGLRVWDSLPVATTYVFQCECGLAWTAYR